MPAWDSKFVAVDGIRTHYIEAGSGPTVVLMHSGEFGAAAEVSWERTIPALAGRYRVVAPDWLGFGRTDKVFDFAAPRERSLGHMRRFFEVMQIAEADFVGNSFGGSTLVQIAARRPVIFPLRSLTLCSGGGFTPDNEHRRTLLAYDGSEAAMRALVRAMMFDPRWADDDAHIAKRQEFAHMPGAFECASAPRLRAPFREGPAPFGQPDMTPYENVAVPTLVVAGAEDRLREKGYAQAIAQRIPDCEVHVLADCGHCPNIEKAEEFNALLLAFLDRQHARR
jgi:pimeloyl-ACP methyl ester carboxylesterase